MSVSLDKLINDNAGYIIVLFVYMLTFNNIQSGSTHSSSIGICSKESIGVFLVRRNFKDLSW